MEINITNIQLLIYNNDFEKLIFVTDKKCSETHDFFKLQADVCRNTGTELVNTLFGIKPEIIDLRYNGINLKENGKKEGGVMVYDEVSKKFIKRKKY